MSLSLNPSDGALIEILQTIAEFFLLSLQPPSVSAPTEWITFSAPSISILFEKLWIRKNTESSSSSSETAGLSMSCVKLAICYILPALFLHHAATPRHVQRPHRTLSQDSSNPFQCPSQGVHRAPSPDHWENRLIPFQCSIGGVPEYKLNAHHIQMVLTHHHHGSPYGMGLDKLKHTSFQVTNVPNTCIFTAIERWGGSTFSAFALTADRECRWTAAGGLGRN